MLSAYVTNLPDELIGVLARLADRKPMYDEKDVPALKDEEITRRWEDFAAGELGDLLSADVRDRWLALPAGQQANLFVYACEQVGYRPERNGAGVLWSRAFDTVAGPIAGLLRRWPSPGGLADARCEAPSAAAGPGL